MNRSELAFHAFNFVGKLSLTSALTTNNYSNNTNKNNTASVTAEESRLVIRDQ